MKKEGIFLLIFVLSGIITYSTCATDSECGNAIIEGIEECDDVYFNSETCQTIKGNNFHGYLLCNNDCTINVSECYECGNGIVENDEDCDEGKYCEDMTSCFSNPDCLGIGDGICKTRNSDSCFDDCTFGPKLISDSNTIKLDYPGDKYDIFYNCDENGNIISEKKIIDGFMYLTSYKYDNDSNIISYDSPIENVKYEYDFIGNVIKETKGNQVTTYDYDEFGRITCINCQSDATGAREEYVYDSNDHVIYYQIDNFSISQEFDSSGKLSKITTGNGGVGNYNYDELGNLISIVSNGYFENRTFNECGTTDNFEYDDNCNLIDDGFYEYQYNHDSQIISKTSKTTKESIIYHYNPDGNLIKIDYPDGTSELYIYHLGEKIKYIDRGGNINIYINPGDESTIVSEESFHFFAGDKNLDKKINFQDIFIAIGLEEEKFRLKEMANSWILE